MSDFTNSETVKANKSHTCEHCRGKITSGQFYLRISGMFEGDIFSIKAHPFCEQIRDELVKACKLEAGDTMLDLPDEIFDSLHNTGVPDIAIRYNKHAESVGGVVVDMSEFESAQRQDNRAGPSDQGKADQSIVAGSGVQS